MKSLYIPSAVFKIGQQIEVQDDDYHHLVVVSRIKKNEEVLLLNGSGEAFLSKIIDITKKNLKLEVSQVKTSQIRPRHSVMILIPKKESLDLMIKSCVELAVKEIILVRGDHSVERLPDDRKIAKMIKQAIEQSNSYYHHRLTQAHLKEFNFSLYSSVNILDLNGQEGKIKNEAGENELLLVGPEGGFSESEKSFFQTIHNAKYISFPTNILRAPTALIAGLGWLYAKN